MNLMKVISEGHEVKPLLKISKNPGNLINTILENQNDPEFTPLDLKQMNSLPKCPKSPLYQLENLEYIKSDKEVFKNKPYANNVFFKLPCGLFYEGDLKYGKMSGKGYLMTKCFNLSDKNKEEIDKYLLFEGEFEDNHLNGKGVLYFDNGSKFDGHFKKGIAHGNGRIEDKQGTLVVEGIWLNGAYTK